MMTLISKDRQSFKMNKLVNFDDLYSSQKDPRITPLKRTQLFQKYFPKYLNKITIPSRNGSYFSKLKRTKIIQDFESSRIFWSRQDWKVLFINQSKSLKILRNYDQSQLQFEKKIKFFTNVSNIKIAMLPLPPSRNQPFEEDKSLNKACKMMRRLKHMKNLNITRLSKKHKSFLHQLNSSSSFLGSFKRLSISFEREASCDHMLLEILTENKNLLKYITDLNLGSLCSPYHYQSFQGLANSCANLSKLSFEFCCRPIFYNLVSMKRFSDNCFPVETDYLGTLRTFPNLKVLSLDIADIFTFLKDFAVPASLQYVRLNFEECFSKEILLKLENNLGNTGNNDAQVLQIFEESQTLISFYERFRELSDVDKLEILFCGDSDEEAYKYQNYLSQNILKRIPLVKNLSFKFSMRCWELNKPCEANLKDNYLSKVLASCKHETLETLEIGERRVFYSNFDLSALRNKLTKLSRIIITGRFDDENYASNNGVFSFLKEMISLGESIKTIKITTVGSSKIESLLSLGKQIEQLDMPKTLEVHLDISLTDAPRYSKSDCDDAITELEKIQRGGSSREKRFFARLFCPMSAMFMKDFLKAYGDKFEKIKIFDCLAPIQ